MKILFATSNTNKIIEASAIFAPLGYVVEQLVVDGKTPKFIEPQTDNIEEISGSKMHQSLEIISETDIVDNYILVEDSGLFIRNIGGFPGVYSSYVEKKIGNEGIINILADNPDRVAEYRAYSVLYRNGKYLKSLGICRGKISTTIRGSNGFGFDPIFIPDGGDGRTFGEMSDLEKGVLSHRGESLRILSEELISPSK
jgi:XTP/dITP diphosphohydrolase